jgi:hypothetical protein
MFTNALNILDYIKTLVANNVAPGITNVYLDEPLDLVYSDLPLIAIYPIKEDFVYDSSTNTEDKKQLSIRIEIRLPGGPASSTCTPVLNTIATAIKADKWLGGLSDYTELQTIQWANDTTSNGKVSGASLDIQVNYLT